MYNGVNSVIKYECSILNGIGKQGNLKCDPDGYYDVILGAFNVRNTRQDLWPWDTSEPFFNPSSVISRRTKNGQLYGEWGHPYKIPGMSEQEFLQRVLNVYEDNVSHHIKSFEYDQNPKFDGENGEPAILFMGRVKPYGPRAECVASALENNAQNSGFSIRTLTRDQSDHLGRKIKRIVAMVTWDAVLSPGIALSTKYNTPSLESDTVDLCTIEQAKDLYRTMRKSNYSFESGSEGESIHNLIRELNTSTVDSKTGLILPASARW